VSMNWQHTYKTNSVSEPNVVNVSAGIKDTFSIRSLHCVVLYLIITDNSKYADKAHDVARNRIDLSAK